MGQEITTAEFKARDFSGFSARLRDETAQLKRWFDEGKFADCPYRCGAELEAWLVDKTYQPSASNGEFLNHADHPLVFPELAQFNFELNTSAFTLNSKGDALFRMEKELQQTWQHCRATAHDLGLSAIAIGTMPTLSDGMLSDETMSDSHRYHALNEQLERQNGHARFYIGEGESLFIEKAEMVLEAASTSLQVHFQVPCDEAVRAYNAALIASAPLVAMAANSPFFYGRSLWEETRIAICEQVVPSQPLRGPDGQPWGRVGFGSGYARNSLLEPFLENLECFSPLLPAELGEDPETLPHLRLHNGTIWRWNRPILDFDSKTGKPVLRIEQRVMASGPSIADSMANVAFCLGLTHALAQLKQTPEAVLPFASAKANFYEAAKFGLGAEVMWLDGKTHNLQSLIVSELLPLAREGLDKLGVAGGDANRYINDILLPRARSGRTGAAWQKSFMAVTGADFPTMLEAYATHQKGGQPVHQWPV